MSMFVTGGASSSAAAVVVDRAPRRQSRRVPVAAARVGADRRSNVCVTPPPITPTTSPPPATPASTAPPIATTSGAVPNSPDPYDFGSEEEPEAAIVPYTAEVAPQTVLPPSPSESELESRKRGTIEEADDTVLISGTPPASKRARRLTHCVAEGVALQIVSGVF